VSRFGPARQLASWAGPTTGRPRQRPRRPLRAQLERKGRCGCGGCGARRRRPPSAPPEFAATFQAIAKRRGTKIATTAVARTLATRAWHLRTDAAPQPAASAARAAR